MSTDHRHSEFVEDCYRCHLSRDEANEDEQQRVALRAAHDFWGLVATLRRIGGNLESAADAPFVADELLASDWFAGRVAAPLGDNPEPAPDDSYSDDAQWQEYRDQPVSVGVKRPADEVRGDSPRTRESCLTAAAALMGVVHELDDDASAELLTRRAIQWEEEAASVAGGSPQPADPAPNLAAMRYTASTAGPGSTSAKNVLILADEVERLVAELVRLRADNAALKAKLDEVL